MNLTNCSCSIILILLLISNTALGTSYFVHPVVGNDESVGTAKEHPFQTLQKLQQVKLNPGDEIILAKGQTYSGSLNLINQQGSQAKPILIYAINWSGNQLANPIIDFKGKANGILIQDCSYIHISNIQLTGDGFKESNEVSEMRCGLLVTNSNQPKMSSIYIDHIDIKEVYYENAGFSRGKEEVHSANGTQKYGWGIRVINKSAALSMENIQISNCSIKNVSHTGIKLTGNKKNIKEVRIIDNTVEYVGGPGIQMSEVQSVYVANNTVDHSGSNSDSRKWGRGSGLWTWGSSNVLIEKNKFLYANGPGDSAGAHIDFNCDNVFIQYNLSAYNAGGFCEILGNNYNCAYRYNVSINDGYRIKGKNGAFQEGKTLWLSGYQGDKAPRKGPVNTYIYNNTIYCDATIEPKLAFDNTSSGILIANNIFHIENNFQAVLGDQYKPDNGSGEMKGNVVFENNLFLSNTNWPNNILLKSENPFYGNSGLDSSGNLSVRAFSPKNIQLVKNRGIEIPAFPMQKVQLSYSLKVEEDILGKKITGKPSLGAIEPIN